MIRTTRPLLPLVALLALANVRVAAGQAPADPPVVAPDRPDLADGIQIVPRGHWQIEGGTTLTRGGGTDLLSVGEVMVRIPWTERVETRVQLLGYGVTSGEERLHGFFDPAVDVKWKLFDSAATDFGVIVGSTLPAGSREYRDRHLQPYATLALDRVLGDRVGATFNLGGASVSGPDETIRIFSGGASFAFTLSPRVSAFLEGYAWDRTEPGGSGEQILDGGLQLLVSDRLMLDLRLGAAFGRTAADSFVGIGAAVLF